MGRMKPAALLLRSKKKRGPAGFSATTISACNVVIILFLLSIFAVYKFRGIQQDTRNDGDLIIDSVKEGDGSSLYAILNTTKGLITLQLFEKEAPKTAENFVTHSKNGYYNSTIFHRVIKGFMIQGGDPQGNGYGGDSIWGGKFKDELSSGLKHEPFTLSMANSGPDTNGSQFFITTVGMPHLNSKQTVFGRVVQGQEVVQDIEDSETDSKDQPLTPVLIHNIQIRNSL